VAVRAHRVRGAHVHVAVAQPVRMQRNWVHAANRLLRKEGAAKRKRHGACA
jgi:hypothetical protein